MIPIAGLAQPKTAAAPLTFSGRTTARSRSTTASPRRSCSGEGKHAGRRREAARRVAKAKGKAGTFEVADEVVPFLPSGPKERVVQKIKVSTGKLDLATQPR